MDSSLNIRFISWRVKNKTTLLSYTYWSDIGKSHDMLSSQEQNYEHLFLPRKVVNLSKDASAFCVILQIY